MIAVLIYRTFFAAQKLVYSFIDKDFTILFKKRHDCKGYTFLLTSIVPLLGQLSQHIPSYVLRYYFSSHLFVSFLRKNRIMMMINNTRVHNPKPTSISSHNVSEPLTRFIHMHCLPTTIRFESNIVMCHKRSS